MWASVEKWAYPHWTYPVLAAHPEMTFGYDAAFYMTAAGVVEFSLAFALAWTPLFRRAAALVLAIMFVMAVFESARSTRSGTRRSSSSFWRSPPMKLGRATPPSLGGKKPGTPSRFTGFVAVYYVAHAELFGTAII